MGKWTAVSAHFLLITVGLLLRQCYIPRTGWNLYHLLIIYTEQDYYWNIQDYLRNNDSVGRPKYNKNNNNNNNNNRFTALRQGTISGSAGTRRNVYPPTILLIIIQSLSASSISGWSSNDWYSLVLSPVQIEGAFTSWSRTAQKQLNWPVSMQWNTALSFCSRSGASLLSRFGADINLTITLILNSWNFTADHVGGRKRRR